MADKCLSRRRVLAAAGIGGSFAGCTGLLDGGSSDEVGAVPSTSPGGEPTSSPTPEPEAAVEVTDVSLREATLTDGGLSHPEEVSVTRNGQKIGSVRITDDD